MAKQYTILNAGGGVSGTFAGPVNTNLPANFQASLSYDANNAYLNLLLNFIPPPSGGLNQNQQNVANAIVGFFNANGTIPVVFGGLTPAGLTQASGEVATGSQQTTFDAMNLFLGLLTDPFVAGRGDPVSAGSSMGASAYASQDKPRSDAGRDAYAAIYRKAPVVADPFTQRWSVWAAGYGGSQTTDGNAALGSNNTTSRIAGGVVGADYRFSPFTLAGFALAGGGTNFSVANGLGSGRSDLFQAGAFIRHTVGPAYLSAALAYGWQDITTDRTVTVAGVDQLRAQFNANAWSGRVEGGYRFVAPWMAWGLRPTPPASSRPSICLPMPSRRWSAPTPLRSPTGPRALQPRVPNSACAAINPSRCRMASSPCADARLGRMISTPTGLSVRLSRRCRAHPSSSMAPHRHTMLPSSLPPPK